MPSIDVRGGQLSFEIFGDGNRETLILLHAAGCSGHQWRAIAGRLEHQFRIVIPNLRGYGGSSAWKSGDTPRLSMEADGVHDLVDALGRRAHLAGHGYGAAVALRAGLDAPQRYAGVTAIEPVSFHLLRKGLESDHNIFLTVAQLAIDMASLAMTGNTARGVERFVEYFGGPGTWAQISLEVRRRMCDRVFSIACNVCALAQDKAVLDDYADYQLPVHLVTGDRTVAPVRRVAERLRSYLPGARQDWLLNAGHMSATSTHAEAVAEMIASQPGAYLMPPPSREIAAA
ncbi:MAG: alpha/beta hydrolase [Rhodospirillales bacterium]